ncbi:2-amino-4-hydroxy-6-hydroxymethyldihydropteridine diphosphokinase [Phormidium pseudopriestleyi FRX01]|uniref:2-amino-4-hydroxy-6-hydroxymethyldihydropteridine diphosphokinase n=1 Tax=Phormidium pseudopriestleyi FRX01 TaxID=1759528 RepID=A0ABS3FWL4_9CYAN|nr:2-amino-4-hydroxy-6-hydroxymethyldihydropteridine diphosphokinase [Phormidium pseudopriestleyi]MBO0351486.1 2-amino-4-hydroxy-6-hydroxymethyldihydropteridine diphosphokinase [Phormidium pseudopriestleyi FRX01]
MTSAIAAIALGSNLGDSPRILAAAIAHLDATPGISVQQTSRWYQTAPIGPPQPDYLNGCALVQVQLTPHQLLARLLEIENLFGRIRWERWGPRTLDLDLLFYDKTIVATPTLEVPHPRMRERAFVLVPLAEIAPDWVDPVSGEAIGQLLQRIDIRGVQTLYN